MGQFFRRLWHPEPRPVPADNRQLEQRLNGISDDWVIVDRPQDEAREHHVRHEGTPVDPPGGGLLTGKPPNQQSSQPQTVFPCGFQQESSWIPYGSRSKPCGSHHYSFVASHKPNLPEASSNRVKTAVIRIKQKYENLMRMRDAVRTSLSEFKKALREPETSDISTCFYVIKNIVGKGVQIDIVHGENPPVRIDNRVWTALPEECRRAIKHFNVVLINCHQFLEGEEEVRTFINDELNQLRHEQHINTQADADTCRKIENLPEEIKKNALELKCFLHDVGVAKSRFEDPGTTTGLLFELQPEDMMQD